MSEDYKVQWSYKLPAGDLVNIRANDVEELEKQVEALADRAAIFVAFGDTIQTEAAKAAILNQFPSSEQIDNTASGGGGKLCAHGRPYVYKTGVGKKGKWGAQFCQVKDDKSLPECQPIWDRD